jgi:formamidopyrimidine-DNA glycosylase
MIEIPEARTLAGQLEDTLRGKTVADVRAAKTPHKFAWYHGDPAEYPARLAKKRITGAAAHGGLVTLTAGDCRLIFGDGVVLRRFARGGDAPERNQLCLTFDDESALAATVQMYGGMWAVPDGETLGFFCHGGAGEKPSPLEDAFDEAYFDALRAGVSEKLSLKAFLATEQRIPGLGNGVLQDILYNARLHPKKKLGALSDGEFAALFSSVKNTLAEMTRKRRARHGKGFVRASGRLWSRSFRSTRPGRPARSADTLSKRPRTWAARCTGAGAVRGRGDVLMKPTEMLIRLEAPCDYRTVEELVREAFWNVNVPGCSEHYLAHVLRGHEDFIAGLDFVAVADGRLAGQIMYTNGIVADDAGREYKVLSFGPIAVLPEFQKQGIGAALVRYSANKARAMGHRAILIYGDPDYYGRLGFSPAARFLIAAAGGEFHPALQALELYPEALSGIRGRFLESPAYHVDEEAAAAFDGGFAKKEKFVTESQRKFARLAGLPVPE